MFGGAEEYEDSLRAYRDVKNSIDTALEQGRKEGENKKTLQIAKNLLAAGMDASTVMKMPGLSEEEMKVLKTLPIG